MTAIVASSLSFGQSFSELAKYEFKTVESYKSEQSKVLECSNYLFNNPSNKDESNRLTATQYILKWMEGTPDYTFDIDKKVLELTKGNSDLLGLYFAAMSKVVLENENHTLNSEEIYNQAEKLLVDYSSNSGNKIKPSKKIKKILKSRKG